MNIQNIKKRAAAEKRFKFYGKFSIFTAITLLIVLFTSIISQGSSAFLETKILLPVHFDSNILDPKNTSNIEEIKKGNFNLIVKRSILEYFPEISSRSEKKAASSLVSSSASYHLKKILSISTNSEKENVLLSNRLETDILMRFAGTKQISDAITSAGMKPKNNFLLIAIGNKTTLDKLYQKLKPIQHDYNTKGNKNKGHFTHAKSVESDNEVSGEH